MKGFSLLEFLIATSFLLLMLLSGYQAFDSQLHLSKEMFLRTRPEEESNYRLLVVRNTLNGSSEKQKLDPFLAEVPLFFTDLNFGKQKRADAFSIAIPRNAPRRFQRENDSYRIPLVPSVQIKQLLLLAGVNSKDQFDWNYATVVEVLPESQWQILKLNFLLARDPLDYGALMEAEINGLSFKNNTLYWVTPAGQSEPFFSLLNGFGYEWNQQQLTVSWQAGQIDSKFSLTP